MLHIGKTGGTAVKHALGPYLASGPFEIIMHPHRVKLHDIPEGERVFFFLRDPPGRFVSGFYSRQRQGAPRYSSPWSPEEEEAFSHFETPNQLAEDLSHTDPAHRQRAEKAMRDIRHVRDEQMSFLGGRHTFEQRVDDLFFVGFQETLDADITELTEKLGLPPGISLPKDDAQAHRNPAHVDRRLSEVAMANLRTWYAVDHDLIAICRARMARP